jgi:hypothetical protein
MFDKNPHIQILASDEVVFLELNTELGGGIAWPTCTSCSIEV